MNRTSSRDYFVKEWEYEINQIKELVIQTKDSETFSVGSEAIKQLQVVLGKIADELVVGKILE